jgi:hypothetical protein
MLGRPTIQQQIREANPHMPLYDRHSQREIVEKSLINSSVPLEPSIPVQIETFREQTRRNFESQPLIPLDYNDKNNKYNPFKEPLIDQKLLFPEPPTKKYFGRNDDF